MEEFSASTDLKTLLGSYDGNIYEPEIVIPYINSLTDARKEFLKMEIRGILEDSDLCMKVLRSVISGDFQSGKAGKDFLKSFYAYIFEGGEEPDIFEYTA